MLAIVIACYARKGRGRNVIAGTRSRRPHDHDPVLKSPVRARSDRVPSSGDAGLLLRGSDLSSRGCRARAAFLFRTPRRTSPLGAAGFFVCATVSAFKIDKDVPAPESGQRRTYPFSDMQPGDSFFVPGRTRFARSQRRSSACHGGRKKNAMSKKRLEPCPFCGSKAELERTSPVVFVVMCTRCNASGPPQLIGKCEGALIKAIALSAIAAAPP
jgi:hypothetical protein